MTFHVCRPTAESASIHSSGAAELGLITALLRRVFVWRAFHLVQCSFENPCRYICGMCFSSFFVNRYVLVLAHMNGLWRVEDQTCLFIPHIYVRVTKLGENWPSLTLVMFFVFFKYWLSSFNFIHHRTVLTA